MQPYLHKVQYYETDQMCCVHHSNYVRWFEEARSALLESIGYGYAVMEKQGVMCPVLKLEAAYKSMARYGETVQISVDISAYTGSTITFSYQVYDRETNNLRCTGESRHCFINSRNRPVSLRKALPGLDEVVRGMKKNTNEIDMSRP